MPLLCFRIVYQLQNSFSFFIQFDFEIRLIQPSIKSQFDSNAISLLQRYVVRLLMRQFLKRILFIVGNVNLFKITEWYSSCIYSSELDLFIFIHLKLYQSFLNKFLHFNIQLLHQQFHEIIAQRVYSDVGIFI